MIKNVLKTFAAVFGAASAIGFLRYLVFLIAYLMKQRRARLPLPPGPLPLPVLGSLLSVAKYTGPDGNPLVHLGLMDIGKKYNGVFGLWLGAGYTVVITKPSVAEEAFCDHQLDNGEMGRGAITTDRAMNQSHGGHHVPTMRAMTRDGQGIAMSYGAYWRKVRGRLVNSFTNPKVAERNAPMVMEEVNSVVWSWRQRCLRGEPITDLTAQLKRESMNMAMRLLFSRRFGAEMPQDFRDLQRCVEYFFCNLSAGNPSDMIPALRVIPNPFLADFQKMCDLKDRVIRQLLNEHRAEFETLRKEGKMSDRSQARDVADLFLFDLIDGFDQVNEDGSITHEFLTLDQVEVSLWDIVFASTDTTSTTNEWMVYHLVSNPEVAAKVREELNRIVGPDRLPTLEDRPKLVYFWAFLREVFRFRIVSPVMAPHYAKEDMTLHDTKGKEFFIPRGTAFFLHGYSMGLDPELWDEPEKFNPDRWLPGGRDETLDLYGQVRRTPVEHYKFIPFSLGPRMCPGYSFAKVAQFLQSATLAHCFEYSLTDKARADKVKVKNGKLDMTETWGLTIMPQRYGEMGYIQAKPMPAARLTHPLHNDINRTKTFLNREEQKVTLAVREQLSPDTALLRFTFGPGKEGHVLGLPLGKHVKLILPNLLGKDSGKWNGRDDPELGKPHVERAYTPTSSDNDPGYIDLLVKVYAPGAVERFPDGGKVSQQLGKMRIGDQLTIKGPFGLIEYLGRGRFKIGRNEVAKKFVGMMAGGSGITPMLQILVAALEDADRNEDHTTKFSLIYANQTEADILCRDRLEDLERRFPKRFRLHYTLDRPPAGWKYSTGFIDGPMIAEHMPPPNSPDAIIFACGPPPMVQFACKANLEKLGYDVKENFAVF